MAGKRARPGRRPNGEGSVTRTRSGVRYRVPVGQDSAGRTVTKDFYGATEELARIKHAQWMAEHPSGPPTVNAAQPMNYFLMTWVNTVVKPGWEISTVEDTLSVIDNHIAPFIGQRPLCDVTTIVIEQWLAERMAATGRGRVLERALGILRQALGNAVRWEVIPRNPARDAKMPKFKRRKACYLTIVQAQAFLAAAEGRLDVRKPYDTARGLVHWPKIDPRLAPLYLLAVTIGPRKGELLALRWGCFDEKAGTLTIRASIDKRRRERGTKTDDSDRTIELDEIQVSALHAHRLRLQAEPHQEGWKPDGLIFPTATGTIMSPRNLDRHFKSVLAAAGLPVSIRFHDLRHSAATLMIAEGGHIVDVSSTLGHATAEVTRKIYAHSFKEGRRRAVAGVSRKLHPK
jgi:integrase